MIVHTVLGSSKDHNIQAFIADIISIFCNVVKSCVVWEAVDFALHSFRQDNSLFDAICGNTSVDRTTDTLVKA